jgi:hypothetical protein
MNLFICLLNKRAESSTTGAACVSVALDRSQEARPAGSRSRGRVCEYHRNPRRRLCNGIVPGDPCCAHGVLGGLEIDVGLRRENYEDVMYYK